MRILITAGGTSEAIDQVREITNQSTGRLGAEIATVFQALPDITIDYVTTKMAIKPPVTANTQLHLIKSTADLERQLETLLTNHTYQAVIHSMAVSDFTTETSLTEEEMFQAFLEWSQREKQPTLADFQEFLASLERPEANKISSATNRLVLFLKKTPKLIQKIKLWQPDTLLIGFKLLVDVSPKELLEVAKESLLTNQADFILANDLREITATNHHGYLLAKDGSIQEAFTKKEIAALLVQAIRKEGAT